MTTIAPLGVSTVSENKPLSTGPKRFHLFGYPIAHSAAPAFHNECFTARGLPHHFAGWSTSAVTNEMLAEIRTDACGGAAVTMPLKNAIMKHLDELTPAAQATGACNTIVKVKRADGRITLVGTNTDVLGVRNALLQTLKAQHPTHTAFANRGGGALYFKPKVASAVIIGGGATTRSAVYALSGLGLAPIFLLNRDDDEVRRVIESFHVQRGALELELIHLRSLKDVEVYLGKDSASRLHSGGEGEGESRERSPNLAIIVGAIPGEHHPRAWAPITIFIAPCFSYSARHASEHLVYTLTTHILSLPYSSVPQTSSAASSYSDTNTLPLPSTPIFLDMAYKPRLTPMLCAASAHGWVAVSGVQAMIEQGLAQQRMWAMNTVDDGVACADAALLGEEVERRARALVEEMQDIKADGVELDRASM